MAKCEGCFGHGQTLMSADHRWPVGKAEAAWLVTCPTCGGAGELSCCDGPAGVATELPTDPNEPSGST
jgi:DnaJ-class molecular chaperone